MTDQQQTATGGDVYSPEPEHDFKSAIARVEELRAEIRANNERGARLASFFLDSSLVTFSAEEVLLKISEMLRDYIADSGVAANDAEYWVRMELPGYGIEVGDVFGNSDDLAIARAMAEIGDEFRPSTVAASDGRSVMVVPYSGLDENPTIYGWLGIHLLTDEAIDATSEPVIMAVAMWVRQHLERAASIDDARRSTEIARIAAQAQILMARPLELDDALRKIVELLHDSSDIAGAAAVRFAPDGPKTIDSWGSADPPLAESLAGSSQSETTGDRAAAVLPVTVDGVPEAAIVLFSRSGRAMLADEMLATVAGAAGGSVARQRAAQTIETMRRSATRQLIEAQERERSMIAADVHDGVLQQLGATAIRLELAQAQVERSDFDSARAIIEDGAKEIRSCARELRSLLMELRPQVLDDNGLSAALKELGRNVENVEIEVSSEVPDDLGNEYSITIFRIVQEALTNIQKHAQATHARVDVHLDDGSVEIEITDDGVGFEAAVTGPSSEGSHLGLLGMSERADMLGGTFSIEGRSGSGTRIVAVLPLKEPEPDDDEAAGDLAE